MADEILEPGQQTFAQILKRLRKQYRLTQEELAVKLEVSPNTVKRWESGRRKPNTKDQRELCRFFEVSPKDLGLDDDLPAIKGDPLPHISDPIGREKDIKQLLEYLRTENEHHVITISGMPGIGKTTVAMAAIKRMQTEKYFKDGIVVCDCQSYSDPSQVVRFVLRHLDPQGREPQANDVPGLKEDAVRLLDGKVVLIVLDNLDNIQPPSAIRKLIGLFAATSAKVLLITYERSSLGGLVNAALLLELLEEDEAIDLFVQSYGRQNAQELAGEEWDAVKRIVRALNRHTLAVKLTGVYAAECSRSLQELAVEREQPVEETISDSGILPEVFWSIKRCYDVLPEPAQKLFISLAAFPTGVFGRRAAITLGKVLGIETPKTYIDSFIKFSLIEAFDDTIMPHKSDHERLSLHSQIRAFAMLHFKGSSEQQGWTEEQQKKAKDAIANYYVDYIQTASEEAREEAILADQVNIIEMLKWAKDQQQDDLVLTFCLGIHDFLRWQWKMKESLTYLEWGFSAAEHIVQTTRQASTSLDMLHLARSYAYMRLSSGNLDEVNLDKVRTIFESLRASSQHLGSERTAYFFLAHIALLYGKPDVAERYFSDSLSIREKETPEQWDEREWPLDFMTFCQLAKRKENIALMQEYYKKALEIDKRPDKTHGNIRGQAVNVFSLGQIAFLQEKLDQAEGFFSEALKIIETLKEVSEEQRVTSHGKLELEMGWAAVLFSLGNIAYLKHDLEKSQELLHESFTILDTLKNRREKAWVIGCQGKIAQAQNDPDTAKKCYEEALDIALKELDPLCEADIRYHLALFFIEQGELDKAEEHHRASLKISRRIENSPGIALSCFALGCFLSKNNSPELREKGRSLLQEAVQIYAEMGLQEREDDVRQTAKGFGIEIS